MEHTDIKAFIKTDLECPVCGNESMYLFTYNNEEEIRCTSCGSHIEIINER